MNTIFISFKPARHMSFYLEEKKAPKGSSLPQLVLAEEAFEATSDSLSMPFPHFQEVFSLLNMAKWLIPSRLSSTLLPSSKGPT